MIKVKGVIRSGANYDADLEMYEHVIMEKCDLITNVKLFNLKVRNYENQINCFSNPIYCADLSSICYAL